MEKIVLIGGGGHCKVIIDAILAAKKYDIIGILDSDNHIIRDVMGFPIIGNDNYLEKYFRKGVDLCFITVGSVGNPTSRIRLYAKAKKIGFKFPNIIHPDAVISKFAAIGEGNYIAPGVIINTGAIIGNHCIINTGAIIEHDCKVGDFVHVAPGAKISGGVELKRNSHVGTGSSIREYLSVGENTIIGVGSVVVKDIGDNILAYGNPCLKVRPVNNGRKKRTFIIAEAGVNHNGSLVTAKKLIDAAVKAGADAVKFQTFKAESLVSKYAPKARYQKERTSSAETQLEMLKTLELDQKAHIELIKYCKKRGITFLSSPFDFESIKLLRDLDLRMFKIPSGEITNLPYLKKIGSLNKKIIMSTGMADLDEIGIALDVLISSGTRKDNITVLHCNTGYPTPMEDVNLRAMVSIRDRFNIAVGYSGHSLGIYVPIAAVALGASVIEKHFTLDVNMKGPDHKASIEPDQLREMVVAIRNIEKAMGNGIKKPSPSEIRNRQIVRKSIVAARDINKGEVFTEADVSFKRPGIGISPARLHEVIGRIAKKDFSKDDLIEI